MLLINDLKQRDPRHLELIRSAVGRVISSGWFAMGPELTKFEQAFSNYVGTDKAIGVANGTDSLEISLRALGCGNGDEVISVANAGGYASTAFVMRGVDI
jgi:aminotransferase EvaB